MPTDQLRNRTVGCKMTEAECERLIAVAERDGLTLSEWCREALLQRSGVREAACLGRDGAGRDYCIADDPAECALQTGPRRGADAEEMQRLIERADQDKFRKAQERLAAAATGGAE